MNPWPLLAGALLLATLTGGAYLKGRDDVQTRWDAKVATDTAAARVKEASDREATQLLRKARDAEITAVNDRLRAALERLRQRPDRLPEVARPACQGATGAELSRPDSGFLQREAARADTLRAALAECYAWIDQVTKP